jgi:hypothetical protein
MNSMLSMLPEGEQPGVLFQALFLRRMPAEIRNHLAATASDSPRDMAAHADVLWDARGGAAMMAHVDYNTSNRGRSPQRKDRWQSPGKKSPRGNSGSRQRQQTPGPEGKLCFYHKRFGQRAYACRAPCLWPGG